MSRALLVLTVALVALLSSPIQAHMWMRTPVSRGGLDNIGGTTGPCNGLQAGSGTRSLFETNQQVTFQFRVNQHGPGPFKFSFADGTNGDTFTTALASNIVNDVTAGPLGFDGVNVQVRMPNTTCTTCSIQLTGMAQSDGSSPWFNCADILIGLPGTLGIPFPSSVVPNTSPTTGGETVIITGTDFLNNGELWCRFDSILVPATYVSATEITCTVPPRNTPSTAALEASINNGKTFSSTGTVFTYTGGTILPVITSITPAAATSGQNITVIGEYYYAPDMMCLFTPTSGAASVAVPATYINTTAATCTVPSTVNGVTGLEVNVDNCPYSRSGLSVSVTAISAASLSTASSLVLALALLLAGVLIL